MLNDCCAICIWCNFSSQMHETFHPLYRNTFYFKTSMWLLSTNQNFRFLYFPAFFFKFVSGFLDFFINLLFFLATLRYPQTLISYFSSNNCSFYLLFLTIHSLFVQCTCWRTTSSTLCLIPFLTFTYLINPSFDLTSTLLLIVELKYYAGNPITNILYFYKF